MRKLLGILFAALLAAGPALAQAPQLGAGQVLGNSTAAQRPARAESVSAILDRAISGTRGAILERGASGWAAITPGAINLPLVSGGAGADPAYAALTAPGGGTGQTLYAVGDILYASTTTALSRLADVATGNVLISGGVNTAPSWGKVTASHLNITATSCTNQYVSAISATGVGTCSTVTAAQLGGLGTGVATALGVNIGAAGAVLVNGGALGSPSSAGTIPAFTLGGTISGGGNQINNVVIGASTPLAGSFTTIAYSTSLTGTSTSANALTAGRQGETNPVVQVDASTASVVTGLKIKGAAAAGGVALSAISSGSNEALTIDALGTGTITLNGTATGNVTTPRVLAVTNATNATTSSNGALNVTGGLGVAGNSVFGGTIEFDANTTWKVASTGGIDVRTTGNLAQASLVWITGLGGVIAVNDSAGGAAIQLLGTSGSVFKRPITFGSTTAATASDGETGYAKITASGTAPGAGYCKIFAEAGTTGGTCRLSAYCGTSTTKATILDNIGSGC